MTPPRPTAGDSAADVAADDAARTAPTAAPAPTAGDSAADVAADDAARTAPTAAPAEPESPNAPAEPVDRPTRPGQETSGANFDAVTTTLRRGSRGEGVRAIQQRLGIPADGIFGPQTDQAVRQFQQQNNLQVDGVVGRQTLAALQGSDSQQPGRIGNAPATTAPTTSPRPQASPVDPQAAAAISRVSANARAQIGTDAGDGLVFIVGNGNFLTRTRPDDPRVAAQQAAARAARNENVNHTKNALVEGIKKLAGLSNKKQINEASVTINGGAGEIAELMRMMQLAGATDAKPVDTAMINQPNSHMGGCGCSSCAAKQGPKEPNMGDMIRMISAEELATEDNHDGDFGSATTEPDEKYSDFSASIPSGNDLHKEKGSYPATAGGDNPMKIKEALLKALAEKKKSKPDFLDVDGDGNKKEPMKKALADKKKKKVDEYAKKKKKKYNEAEVQAPNHEISDTARQATKIAQIIKQKINSGDQMDDRDYNQMAELGTILSRLGTSFGPKTMKDVLNHMIEYTDDRNQEGHNYPEFNVDRFKELIAMAKE
jgi:peptidoglycan hydrolase-like protein with peptidoglycan-binding domain